MTALANGRSETPFVYVFVEVLSSLLTDQVMWREDGRYVRDGALWRHDPDGVLLNAKIDQLTELVQGPTMALIERLRMIQEALP